MNYFSFCKLQLFHFCNLLNFLISNQHFYNLLNFIFSNQHFYNILNLLISNQGVSFIHISILKNIDMHKFKSFNSIIVRIKKEMKDLEQKLIWGQCQLLHLLLWAPHFETVVESLGQQIALIEGYQTDPMPHLLAHAAPVHAQVGPASSILCYVSDYNFLIKPFWFHFPFLS